MRPATCIEQENEKQALSPLEPRANQILKSSFGNSRKTTNPADDGKIKTNEIFPQEMFPSKPQFGVNYNYEPTKDDVRLLEGCREWPAVKQ